MLGNKSSLDKNFFYPTLNIDLILLRPLCYCKVDSFKEKTSDKNRTILLFIRFSLVFGNHSHGFIFW